MVQESQRIAEAVAGVKNKSKERRLTKPRQLKLIGILAAIICPAMAQNAPPTPQNSTRQQTGAVLVIFSEPTFPQMAKIADVAGEVRVIVTVYPDGKSDAHIEVGIPLLNQAALESAKQSQFACDACSVPSQYVLVYSFERTHNGDCCNNTSSPVHVTQMPPSVDEQGRPQIRIVVSTEYFCICDPGVAIMRVRAAKCLYLWKCGHRT